MSSGATTGNKREAGPAGAGSWSVAARAVVSALLVWHLAAILVGPFSLPPNFLNDYLQPKFRPYIGALYLDHSYKFFAPDPGPSHLVRYELEFADGSKREGVFPNLNEEWPRLFYHRHFMLSEFINSMGGPPRPEPNQPEGPPPDWAEWPLTEAQQQYARSYAEHLLDKHKAARVTLWLREHGIPEPLQVVQGLKLDDASLYSERKLGSFAGTP